MQFDFKVNKVEVTNPLARLLLGILSLLIGVLVIFLVMFLLLPVFWFFILGCLTFILVALFSLPRLNIYFHEFKSQKQIEKRN